MFSQNCFIHVLTRCINFPKINKRFIFRVSIIHTLITWVSRDQVSSHTRPRLLQAFSPVAAVTSWFTLEPLHTTTVVYISLKKEKNGYENKYQEPMHGWGQESISRGMQIPYQAKPLWRHFYRLIYFSMPFLLWKKGSSGPLTQWGQLVCKWFRHGFPMRVSFLENWI